MDQSTLDEMKQVRGRSATVWLFAPSLFADAFSFFRWFRRPSLFFIVFSAFSRRVRCCCLDDEGAAGSGAESLGRSRRSVGGRLQYLGHSYTPCGPAKPIAPLPDMV